MCRTTLSNCWEQEELPCKVMESEGRTRRIRSDRVSGVNFSVMRVGLLLVFSIILSTVPSPAESTHIRINENGGYEDIVVSIGKEVPPIACQQLIQNIQGILTSSSEYLRRATDGRVYFHRVVIVVPSNWDNLACGRSLPANSFTSRSRVNDAAVRIGSDHPVFGSSPWTQQSRGCGLPGDFISVGYNYILQFNETENVIGGSTGSGSGGGHVNGVGSGTDIDGNDGNDSENGYGTNRGSSSLGYGFNAPVNSLGGVPTERVFVKEWAKFRYGVFEESGFLNDPIYPVSYKENGERKPTSCTNSPLRGSWSSGCDESSWVENKTCIFTPDVGSGSGVSTTKASQENDRITSSIMSFPQLKNVKMFCDQSNHNAKAPTKQNFLCESKSTSEVIYSHPDFKTLNSREPNVPVSTPEFIVKQVTTPRFVLLVEETGNMNLRDVWKFLKLAVRKFIKYDLPTGTQIGLISVSTNDVKVLSNLTSLQTITLRRALADKLPNYPNVDSGGNISLRRGIFQAVEMLKRNQQRAAGSVIILVSQGTVSSPDLEASLELLREEEVTLAAIEYPSLGDGKISLLAEGTNGPHFTIRETGVGPTTHMSTFVQLINALMTIQRFFTEDLAPTWPVMIHQAEYKGDSRSYIEANFSFESSTAQTPAEFFIYTSNPNDPKINSVELTSPNGVKYTTQLSDLHDINVIKIDAVINEPGVWRYRIERLADSHQSHFIQVVTKTSSEDLTARLYTNVDLERPANLSATPLILYAEVKHKKNSPVIDADVEAHITAGNKKWTVRLLDNGNGDPDVTGGDGVYSRYFIVPPGGSVVTQLDISARVVVNPYRARFIVGTSNSSPMGRAFAKQPCCGSRMIPVDPKSQYKIVSFGERTSNSLRVRISDVPPKGFYTPGRIGDLRIWGINYATRNLTLTWTAPGEDLDQGVPASYQVFFSPDRVNENWAVLGEIKADLEAGVQDNATVTLPQYGNYLIAMRAVDFHLKPGKMSNIVKISVTPPPKEPEHSFSSSSGVGGSGSGGGNTLSIKNTTPSPTKEFSRFDLMLIIICGAAFVFLLAGFIVIILYCKRSSMTQRKSSKNPADTKISAITDPKSPIHWSASELLGEHEKRHSLYGGSVSPKSEGNLKGHTELQLTQNQINQHNVPNGHGGGGHHPMHLNIMPSEYGGTNSSTRSRSSPDSYDDPDSPTPIPVSVRHTVRPTGNPGGDYTVCVDSSNRHHPVEGYGSGVAYHHHQHPPHPHHHPYPQHYQIPQNNGGLVVAGGSGYPTGGTPNSRFSTAGTQPQSPMGPQMGGTHLMHYDPELQGSMSSVNSKKRNITMV